jgi:hypothetical protein
VRRHAAANKVSGGRIGPVVANLFAHIAFCEQSGAQAIYVNKKPYFYIHPDLLDHSRYKSWPYLDFERFFLLAVVGLDLGRIFGEHESGINDAEVALGTAQIKLRDIEKKLARLAAALEEGESTTIMSRLLALEAEHQSEQQIIRGLESNVEKEKELMAAASNTATQIKSLMEQKDPATRLLLRQEIRRIVQRIDIRFELVLNDKEKAAEKKEEAAVALLRSKGGKLIPIPSKRGVTITFANGVSRVVYQGVNGEPIYGAVTDSEGEHIELPLSTPRPALPKKRKAVAKKPSAPKSSVKTRKR